MASRRRCKPIGIWPSHQQASAKPVHHDTTTSTGQCHTVIKTTLKILQHLTLTGEMLRRVLQSMCEPIEVLIALTLTVLDLPLQCSPAIDQADQQHRARRRSKFSRCRRRRRTLISSEIGNREVRFRDQRRKRPESNRRGWRASSLNAQRSSMLPPPRQIISTSHSRRSPAHNEWRWRSAAMRPPLVPASCKAQHEHAGRDVPAWSRHRAWPPACKDVTMPMQQEKREEDV